MLIKYYSKPKSKISERERERVKIDLLVKKFSPLLKKIKVFALDVDGILTNGQVYYSGSELEFNRFFHVHDGHIIKILQNAGIKVSIISGGDSIGVLKRLELLKIDPNLIFLGKEDKRYAFLSIKKYLQCLDEEILYMGDELFDIPLLHKAGFSATTTDASLEVKAAVNYITSRSGGYGAVREVADLLRYAQKIYPEIPNFENE